MVALKLARESEAPTSPEPGSRNAVVALKLSSSVARRAWTSRKQERRGGIETSMWIRRFANGAARKQERRGGIETQAPGRK